MEHRMNLVTIVVGNRGTGKTDDIKQLLKASSLEKKLIVDTFDSPVWRNMKTHNDPSGVGIPIPVIDPMDLYRWSEGIYRVFSSDMEELLRIIEECCMDTFIVLEDSAKYIDSKLPKSIVRFLLDSKQKNLDIVLVFHSLSEVPPGLIRRADWIVLHKTNETWSTQLKNKYPGTKVETAFREVNASSNWYERREICISS